jgi:hypothetical protein
VDLQAWVACYFERVGKLIVLDSEEGATLRIVGQLFTADTAQTLIGNLRKDGSIIDASGSLLGQVAATFATFKQLVAGQHGPEVVDQSGQVIGQVGDDDSQMLPDNATVAVAGPVEWRVQGFIGRAFSIRSNGNDVGFIRADASLEDSFENVVLWSPARDTCDLDKVRLVHLDGTSVAVDEYDRIQRFLRLWRKLGWSVDETDKASAGFESSQASGGGAAGGGNNGGGPVGAACEFIGFDEFVDDCATNMGNGGGCGDGGGQPGLSDGCPETVTVGPDLQPAFFHQLRAIRKLLDQTGLPLPNLLALWADIGTSGDKSLYAKLFLSHNLVSIDGVFQADAHGNYLSQPARITDHLPVLMAAFKRKADDLASIMSFASISDSLTLSNVSVIYRYSLLAKMLNVRVPLLADVIALLGNPFKSAWDTLALLEVWG